MKLGSNTLIVAICMMVIVVVQAQDDTTAALCNAQTAVVQGNSGMEMAVNDLSVAVANQTVQCLESGQTSCDINVDSEIQGVTDACTAADGVIVEPTLTVSCDNSNTRVTTTYIFQDAVCVGMNCSEVVSELEEQGNTFVQNFTNYLNVFLNPVGINCVSSFDSGAVSVVFGGLMVALIFGSTISMMDLL